ncbi:hypothetical protein PROSTU_02157 [Providencia stuartii ATCC 25827]|uniref:Uncharacterized protein n=1 Tax=Providencia stuartii ATCC 25827 TaxID=471874 RepID=A0AA86YW62_PROST|nr:hypothetical protein PROSTU_02157 [Providencia stuartii ATCC 25827]
MTEGTIFLSFFTLYFLLKKFPFKNNKLYYVVEMKVFCIKSL